MVRTAPPSSANSPRTTLSSSKFRYEALSAQETKYLESLAETNVRQLCDAQLTFYDAKLWPCVRESPSLRLFQGPPANNDAATTPFRASTTIHASFQELIALFTKSTVEPGQLPFKQPHDGVVDSAIVLEIPSTLAHRRIFVRWMAIECLKPLRNRDFCLLEVHDNVLLPTGARAFVISQHSIRLHEACPDMEGSVGLVRGSMYNSGIVVTETTVQGVLEVRAIVDMDLKGRVPSFLHTRIVRQRAARLQTIHHSIQVSRVKGRPTEVQRDSRSHCAGCHKSFASFFRQWHRKHNCAICGEIFCRHCTQSCTAEPQKRVCNACVGSMVEYTLRSPFTDPSAEYEGTPSLFEDDFESTIVDPKQNRQYHPCTMRENLLQLIEPPVSERRRRPASMKSPDVTLEALRMEYGSTPSVEARTVLFPATATTSSSRSSTTIDDMNF
ncbi:hypothetical protein SPRG_07782 [Saprolegnia parasitica CBS 223.65]|uniref:FYVE-type domain-containing protein n=1 Tax=Saprolegnia parasitica (strain CBS 223.65) TaxID=695850 RepID=A0A067CKH8_SAPPC|nr:hypothetical protein SPRG_07782 [Saprolegnia parasitica CBS 223.65]KDO27071.1 hypothetical protein SPRG_07782 [Saprolegnia parasitica CBS 223.65]|eukprot:XP_012202166.1 hypothetical protein SPRG_07782 [Saprolegnia parasitica CBS 223.65]